ncbi:MAG TPA: class I SAM-dependent methyltransferase [Stellaceae bacterium]|jgi:ubiquinone/menaquinone biosynthesis C-methylase UbiE|nr:class I SAM-dependent methyltransferase [Stellaceae bacterium]
MARKKSPQKKKKSAATPARFYRRIGTRGWRDSNYFTYSSLSPAFRRWLAAELGKAPLDTLSIGCGNGELESELAAAGLRLTGVDLSHPMLKRAMRSGLDAAVEADANALPFAPRSFDAVIFPESIGHLSLAKVFAEAGRVLRPRGTLIVTTYSSHTGVHPKYRKYRLDEMAAALTEIGFAVEEQRYLAARPSAVADAPSDAKATLLYLKSRAPAPSAAISPRAKKLS